MTIAKEGSWQKNFDAASRTIFRISKGFQRNKQNLIFIFSSTLQQKNSKPSAQGHKVQIKFFRP
jgi:hypothetical protein